MGPPRPPKPAQRKKIVGDAFKLAFAATLVQIPPRLILLFSDEEAVAPFASARAWSSAAFQAFGIDLAVVELPEEERAIIRRAQERQFR
ncbi:MAG: hypothetical protein ABJA81_01350 [Nocardioidaceae bacterium]